MIKVGLIGGGYWGKHHLRVLSKLKCQLVGLTDVDPGKEIVAKEMGVNYYSDFKKLLKKVDAVSIVTPPETHYSIARKALKAGVHVLLEKPFVFKHREAENLIEMADKHKLILMPGHIYLYHPAIDYLKTEFESRSFGQLYYMIMERLNLGIVRKDVNAVWNFAPHDISILLFLLKEKPSSVVAIGQSYLQKGIDDVSFLTFRYKSGLKIQISVSWLHPLKVRKITVVGSRRLAVFDDVNIQAQLTVYEKGISPEQFLNVKQFSDYAEFQKKSRFGSIIQPNITSLEPLEEELKDFIQSIENKRSPKATTLSALETVMILEACQSSSKKGGREVEIKYG